MGCLRFLLAMSVVIQHSGFHYKIIAAESAVFAFFIISGFYMSLVLNEKYSLLWDGTRRFYLNRILRLFPTYYVGCVFALVISLLVGQPTVFTSDMGVSLCYRGLLILANLVLFGMDSLMAVQHSGLEWRLVPPAWTLATELMFYLLAPFIVRFFRPLALCALVLISFLVRLLGHLIQDQYFFYYTFPFLMVFFSLGCVSYLIHRSAIGINETQRWGFVSILVLCFYWVCAYFLKQDDILFFRFQDNLTQWGLYLILTVTIPWIFVVSKSSKVDQFIGHCSYPVYILHWPIRELVFNMTNNAAWRSNTVIALTVLVSTLLTVLIENRVDEFRQKLARRLFGSASVR